MIDEQVFKDLWALLCERFNREPSKLLFAAYYSTLSERMDTDQFRAAAQRVFEEREFFPRPLDFVLATRDARADAMTQWEQVQRLMRGDAYHLDAEGMRVVSLLGGCTALKNTLTENVPFIRRDFLQLYGDAAEIAQREAGNRITPTPESLKLSEGIMRNAARSNVIPLPAGR